MSLTARVLQNSAIGRILERRSIKLYAHVRICGIEGKVPCRCLAASPPINVLSPSQNSGKSNSVSDARQNGVPETLVSIRSRMIKLHRLQTESNAKMIQISKSDQGSAYSGDDNFRPDDIADEGKREVKRVDTEFIKLIEKPKRRCSDAYVAMTFGLARFDSMNNPGGRRVQNILKNKEKSSLEQCPTEQSHDVRNTLFTDTANTCEKSCNKDGNLFEEQYFNSSFAAENNSSINPANESKLNLFDDPYFGDELQNGSAEITLMKNLSSKEFEAPVRKNCIVHGEHQSVQNILNENLLLWNQRIQIDGLQTDLHEKLSCELSKNQNTLIAKEMNLFDKQYFGNGLQKNLNKKILLKQSDDMGSNMLMKLTIAESSRKKTNSEEQSIPTFGREDNLDMFTFSFLGNSGGSGDCTVVERITRRELKASTRLTPNIDNPQTAYDYAMKFRLKKHQKSRNESSKMKADAPVLPRESKWTGSVDSKGFRLLKRQVIDLQEYTQNEVVSLLKDSIIYEDDKILAIDKPYGLASHGGPGIHHSIGKLLELLAQRVDKSGKINMLHLVHRLDKETTGVIVLAKTLQVAEFLLAMFKKRQVIKHYWVITKGIPNPIEGVIDIPLMEGTVDNKYRMQLQPVKYDAELGMRRLSTSNTREAVTNYRVLSSHGSAAVVECTPETGVKHQIRCHLAYGLNTPILGDHKYSHFSKIAPQRLHPEILQLLGIRQAKVRHVPMHLHAKALILPEWLNGKNLFISARLPKHFVQNMKWLKLKPTG